MKQWLKMTLVLGIITMVVGALLAWVHGITQAPIAQAEADAQRNAIASVASSDFDNNPMDYQWECTLPSDNQPVVVYPMRNGDNLVGVAVESYTQQAFDGEARIMVGFAPDGQITGYEVLKQTETPGLGAKMGEWFKDPTGKRSVLGRTPGDEGLKVSKDGGDVDAITAATISSRAFLDAINRASKAFNAYIQKQ